jgi:hypothetical protein
MVASEARVKITKLIVGPERERDAIAGTLAMMAYNPAIGRVLEPGGVDRFSDLMVETVPKLYGWPTKESFDKWHVEVCERIMDSFKTARKTILSYGQAQKPVNVFLKVYVDWARQPTRELAEKLAPWLHVPLDSVLMAFVKHEFPGEYANYIGKIRRQRIDRTAERVPRVKGPRAVARLIVGHEFSLAAIDKETYSAWQEFLRDLYPSKPVALDIIWYLERRKRRGQICES